MRSAGWAERKKAARMAQLRLEFDALNFAIPERIAAAKIAEVLDPLPKKTRRKVLRAVLVERAEPRA